MGCTDGEIAALTRSTRDEVDSKKDAIASGRARLKHSIRRAQIKAALKGNSSLLIWLGKMHLGQRENTEPTLSQQTNIVVDAKLLSALQSSYRATLHDIRIAKSSEHAANPDIQGCPDIQRYPGKLSVPDKHSVVCSVPHKDHPSHVNHQPYPVKQPDSESLSPSWRP